MRIGAAQFKPEAGNIQANLRQHLDLLKLALEHDLDLVVFPELSLSAYEPALAGQLATVPEDPALDVLQSFSDDNNISICAGIPLLSQEGILIGMVIFQPGLARRSYAKQILHKDELPFFRAGHQQVMIERDGKKLAPAICFESLQFDHVRQAHDLGANAYLASVAKSGNGLERAYQHYPRVAREFSMPVLLSNCYGPCDDFVSPGGSGVWDASGKCLGRLDDGINGLIGLDLDSGGLISAQLEQA